MICKHCNSAKLQPVVIANSRILVMKSSLYGRIDVNINKFLNKIQAALLLFPIRYNIFAVY